jgi:hypothetical protein
MSDTSYGGWLNNSGQKPQQSGERVTDSNGNGATYIGNNQVIPDPK